MNKENKITEQQYHDYWEYMIKNDIIYGDIQTIDTQQLKDLSLIKNNHGKIKFKKHNSSKHNIIKIGDKVDNDGDYGEVIDIDGDLLCVRIKNGDIRIWDANNVKKIGDK